MAAKGFMEALAEEAPAPNEMTEEDPRLVGAKDLLRAFDRKDPEGIVSAFQAMHDLCASYEPVAEEE